MYFFSSSQVRDLHLGSHFPTIRSVEVRQVSQDPVHHRIDTLELCLDVHYSGSFQLSLDANLVLGRAAYLSVTGRFYVTVSATLYLNQLNFIYDFQ